MADTLRPLTLLLAAAALWALCVLILALSGLGGRFIVDASDAAPPPLPKVALTRTQSRLGPLANYAEVGARPLLMADRRPGAQVAAGGDAGTDELDVMLTSVLITPRLQLAILTNASDASTRRVRLGEMVEGSNWRLVQLQPRMAMLEGPGGQRSLELRVFNGLGGQAPTPVSTNRDAAPASNGDGDQAGQSTELPPPPPPPPRPSPQAVTPVPTTTPTQEAVPVTQEQQIEAIRRRIEARRAQMRAEAEAAGATEK